MVQTDSTRPARLARCENLDFEVLSLLDQGPVMAQRDIARQLQVSLGRINACLKSLVARGVVRPIGRERVRSGLRQAYALTAQGIAQRQSLASAYLERKLAEYDRLTAQIESLRRALGTGSEV